MAEFIDRDGDGFDDRIAAWWDEQSPGWRDNPPETLARIQADARTNHDAYVEAAAGFVKADADRTAGRWAAGAPGADELVAEYDPDHYERDLGRIYGEMAGALPSAESMTFRPEGYSPTTVDQALQASARPMGAAVAGQQTALNNLQASLRRPDVQARVGLQRAQEEFLGGGAGSRQGMAQAALGAGQEAAVRRLGRVGQLGADATEMRSSASNEALTRAGAADANALANARAQNEALAYYSGARTGANIHNAQIPSRRLGMRLQLTDLQRGAFDRAQDDARRAQDEAAERTRRAVGGVVTAAEGAIQTYGRATADDAEDEKARTPGWRK